MNLNDGEVVNQPQVPLHEPWDFHEFPFHLAADIWFEFFF